MRRHFIHEWNVRTIYRYDSLYGGLLTRLDASFTEEAIVVYLKLMVQMSPAEGATAVGAVEGGVTQVPAVPALPARARAHSGSGVPQPYQRVQQNRCDAL